MNRMKHVHNTTPDERLRWRHLFPIVIHSLADLERSEDRSRGREESLFGGGPSRAHSNSRDLDY